MLGLDESEVCVAECGVDVSGFDLVVVGHSLGAGVAALVSMRLKSLRLACYDTLHCVALSPPPSLSPAAAASARDFVTSVSVEGDLISTMSWRSLQVLRARCVEALLLCPQPKWQVLLFLGIFRRAFDEDRLRDYFFLPPASPAAAEILGASRALFESGCRHPPLRLPGAVFLLRLCDVAPRQRRHVRVRMMQAGEEEEIVVSRSMVMNHLPGRCPPACVPSITYAPRGVAICRR